MAHQLDAYDGTANGVAVTDGRPLTALLVTANLFYPFALHLFFRTFQLAAQGSLVAAFGATVAFACVLATPALGFATILRLGSQAAGSAAALRVRRLAHFSVAAPPLYTATGVLLFTLDLPGWDMLVWFAVWLTVLIVLSVWPAPAERPAYSIAGTPPAWLRWSHGLAAGIVLLGYIGLHLGNHLFGLVGAEIHAQVQDILRLWYRAPAVEPVLVGLMVWLIGSGVALARHRTLSFTDGWGALQTASGGYLGAFLFSHMTAALIMARGKFGIDTTWEWAAGAPDGLLGDAWSVRLIPHYLLAVAAVTAHAACGLRTVLLAHNTSRGFVDRLARVVIAGGVLLALTLVAALLGLRL